MAEESNDFADTIKALVDGAGDGIKTGHARFTSEILRGAIATNPVFHSLKFATNDLCQRFQRGTAVAHGPDKDRTGNPITAAVLTIIEGSALAIARMLAPIQSQEYRDAMRAHFLALLDEAQGIFDQDFADWDARGRK